MQSLDVLTQPPWSGGGRKIWGERQATAEHNIFVCVRVRDQECAKRL